MERIEYDHEIDPSIREEREEAERERELTARIRIEIERYVEENRDRSYGTGELTDGGPSVPRSGAEEIADGGNKQRIDAEARDNADDADGGNREQKREAKREQREAKREQRAANATKRRKAIGSVFTGSILTNERIRTMWPYLLVFAVLLVGYIAQTFQLQKLNLERQALEREVRELGVEALSRTAERVRGTSRSAIVDKLAEKEIPLKEFPHPVKRVER